MGKVIKGARVVRDASGNYKLGLGRGRTLDLPDEGEPAGSSVTIVVVSASRALTADDNGKVLRCSTALTLEYPEGLGNAFACIVEPPSSGNVTVDPTGSCSVNGGTTNLTRSRSSNPAGFVIRALAANVSGVSGS